MTDFLQQNVPAKAKGQVTVVGYLGIAMGVFFMALPVLGVIYGSAPPSAAGFASFVFFLGVTIAVLCYRYVRR